MKIQIVENKYINAVLLVMLFSAGIHMLILFYLALISGNFYLLNYFNIIDLDVLFPSLFTNSPMGNIVSVLLVVLLYFFILKYNRKENSI